MYTPVDLENWNRKDVFEFFTPYEDPFFNVTVPLDVTSLVSLCKSQGYSFAAACLYYSQKAANTVREFKIRLLDDQLVEFDRVEATQTVLQDDESFSFCYLPWQADLAAFNESAREAVEKYKALRTFDVESDRVDLIYYSVLPWMSFTSFKHATKFNARQTVPRIAFGKYFEEGSKTKMPISVEVNHMIMDGIHVGKYLGQLQNELDICLNQPSI